MKRDKSRTVALVIGFVAVITMVGAITFNRFQEKTKEEFTKAKNQMEKEMEQTQHANTDQVQDVLPEATVVETPIVEEPIVETPTLSFTESNTILWPVEGNILLNYSMDQTIYFPTLDQYKYHSAVVISGEVGAEVRSVADGKVVSIGEDSKVGNTLTIDLGDGFQAIYGQLGEIVVRKGDYVKKGDIIGYLGEPTKYYTVEGPNLYFQFTKKGKPVNPLEYLDV